MSGSTLRTEVRGLDFCLDDTSLSLSQSGENLFTPIRLSPIEAETVALAMAKSQLWEWNQLEESKSVITGSVPEWRLRPR